MEFTYPTGTMSTPPYSPIYPRLPLEDMPQRPTWRRVVDLLLGRQSLLLSPFIDVEYCGQSAPPELKQNIAVSRLPVVMT
jgi:hypothetical protein